MSFNQGDHNGDPTPSSSTSNFAENVNTGSMGQAQLENVLNTLYQRIQELEIQQQARTLEQQARATQPPPPPTLPASTLDALRKPREPKASAPEHFRGERSKLNSFITQLNVCFTLEPSRFTTERSKILFAATQFRDKAMNWLRPQLEHYMAFENGSTRSSNLNFTTFDEFAQHLRSTFGDINEEATAERDLRVLRQTSSVAFYTSEFQRIVSVLHWDEKALIFMFYTGLKDNIKDELSKIDKPTTLNDLINISMKIDARQYDRFRERQFEKRSIFPAKSPSTAPPTPNFPSFNTPHHDPMELDASLPSKATSKPRGKLSDAERKRRRDNNLCNYCGEPHHVVATCPLLVGQRTLAASNEEQNNPPSTNFEQSQPSENA